MAIGEIYILILWILSGAFAAIVSLILIGFFFKPSAKKDAIGKLTILIPFKNDYLAVEAQMAHLKRAIPAERDIRIVYLDDHSNDIPKVNVFSDGIGTKFLYRKAPDEITGKKAVVRHAIQTLETDWVLLLDVDSKPEVRLFDRQIDTIPAGAKMILVPLRPGAEPGFFRPFFDLDFLSLHLTGLGSARLGIPVLANAAALLISREAFVKTEQARTDWDELSGDDIYLMMAVKKMFGARSVAVALSRRPLCTVSFPTDFKTLWHQRLRWISKVNRVRSAPFQIYSWVVLLTQLALLSGFIAFIAGRLTLPMARPLLFILDSEMVLLISASIFAERPKLIAAIIPSVFIYPFYLFGLIVSRIFVRPIWK